MTATAMKMNQITSSVSVIVNFPPCVHVTTDRKTGPDSQLLRHQRHQSSRLQNAAAPRKRQWVRSADNCVACLPTYGSGDDADPLSVTRHVRTTRQRPAADPGMRPFAGEWKRAARESGRRRPSRSARSSRQSGCQDDPRGRRPQISPTFSSTIQRGPRTEPTMSLLVHEVNRQSLRSPSPQRMESPATRPWNRVDR